MSGVPDQQRRAYWLKTLHEWHWISAALCLVGMLLFAVTGFTLNHAGLIESKPVVQTKHGVLPPDLLKQIRNEMAEGKKDHRPVPRDVGVWLQKNFDIDSEDRPADWSDDELYLSLPRPGGDAWTRVSMDKGEVEYEKTTRGLLSYLNDLHKGRNAGLAWSWFIDLFALAALVFSTTGLFILKMHAKKRALTWPVVGLGFVIPLVLVLIFVH